jgi:hypothetical protein
LDPGRGDLLFGMNENNSVDNKKLHPNTSSQTSKETRSNRYKKLRTEVKNGFNDILKLKPPFQEVIEALWILTFMANI